MSSTRWISKRTFKQMIIPDRHCAYREYFLGMYLYQDYYSLGSGQDDRFEPVFQNSPVLILRIADKDKQLAPVG